jgi:hypothetical protein
MGNKIKELESVKACKHLGAEQNYNTEHKNAKKI